MTPLIHILIMAGGTDDNDPMSLAQRWRDDPYNTFASEFIRAKNWCDFAGQPLAICWYEPCGYPRETIQRFDAARLMMSIYPAYVGEVRRVIRDFAPQCNLPMMVYLGSLARYNWQTRTDIRQCVEPYMMQGYTSLAIDAMADAPINRNIRPLDGLAHAFNGVYCEGQYRTVNPWMSHAGYLNIITGDWRPADPSRYIPMRPGDAVLISTAPPELQGNKATDEQRAAWRRARCGQALRDGLNPIIGASNIVGHTYEQLLATA